MVIRGTLKKTVFKFLTIDIAYFSTVVFVLIRQVK